ncbi:MAG: Sensor histidine kinase RcsC [Syntrophus sp. SKADARSKE-3]|nr:Sensor histidine kinase RcsC [Syntrophus sp. SKADARSKE-3]
MEQKRIEESLRQSEAKYRILVENTKDLILHVQKDGMILFASEAALPLFGYDPKEMMGKAVLQFVHPDDRHLAKKTLDTATESGRTESAEFRLTCAEGPYRWVEVAGKYWNNDQTGQMDTIMVIRDIMDRKQADKERLILGKLESAGTLAGGIAHDFNNLLSAIVGNIELALADISVGSDAAECLFVAEKAAWAAQSLTRQLITISKGETPITKVISLASILKEHVAFSLHGASIKAVFSIASDLWPIQCDESQIGQVIRNLVLNAREAMPRGGIITVEAQNIVLQGQSSPTFLPDGNYVKVSISDQGEGIRSDDLPKIFDPYFSTKERGNLKGMGLGLTICHSIIDKHNGVLSVETEPGMGTTFHIYLPAPINPLIEEKAVRQVSERSGRILVMDDEEMMRTLLGKTLMRAGYDVDLAKDGEEALSIYFKQRGEGRRYDVVILDLTIRGGMGGVETLSTLREVDPDLKAVVTSGYSDHPVIQDYVDYGFNDVLVKPYRTAKLLKIIAEVMVIS